ncbi:MAG: glycoside hydrolase family 28 protein, partial [Bryobacteraceae bacterium]
MSISHARRNFLAGLAGAGAFALPARAQNPAAAGLLNVKSFGAAGDGVRLDTEALQAAIDACAGAGGGTVYFPAGRYHTGGLVLRSHVHLYLDAGATLLGSTRLDDYPVTRPKIRSYTDNYTERSLIFGEDLEDVGLHGPGAIDGRGAAFKGPYRVRPYLIRLVSCRQVAVTGVTLRDSPMWVQHYLACEDVLIDGITVRSHVNANNDGIDIDCCQRVVISDCNISSGDDAIVLKSTSPRPTRHVAVVNCVLSSICNAFKLGTESNGGFEDIVLSNCTMYETRLSGLAIEMVDGGVLDRISVSNVVMRDVNNVLFIRLGDRGRPYEEGGPRPGVGRLRNVQIAGIQATGASNIGCPISGIPGHYVENVSIRDVDIGFTGGVKQAPEDVPEHPDRYPEHKMFGTLPAYGFFCRHVRNLRL